MSRFGGGGGGHGRVLNLIKNISLVLDFSLCNFRELIYAQSACNTPKRKHNLKSHHMTPLRLFLFPRWQIFLLFLSKKKKKMIFVFQKARRIIS